MPVSPAMRSSTPPPNQARRRPGGTAAAVLLATALCTGAAWAQDGGRAASGAAPSQSSTGSQSELGAPSAAEQLLFMRTNLSVSPELRTLVYDYVAEAQGVARTTDRATLTLAPGTPGRGPTVHGDYLSGALAVHLPDLEDVRTNPIVLYFLESDVRLLERTTHGQSAHFRRRIRAALADSASVGDTTVRWHGHDVAARIVRVSPFLTDPYRERFAREASTEYAFVLSDAIPGGVYRITATIPGDSPNAPPLAQRSLTIADTGATGCAGKEVNPCPPS
jgi:hypothetical protein